MKRVSLLPAVAAAAFSLCFVNAAQAQITTTFGGGAGGSIPDPGSIESTIIVNPPVGALIQSLNSVTITGLTHTYAGDVTATLSHGTTAVYLLLGNPNLGRDFNGTYTFAPGGTTFPTTGTAGIIAPVTYAPIDSFSAFSGLLLGGNWTLTLRDDEAPDAGTFTGWSFNTTYTTPVTPFPTTYNGAGGNLVDASPSGTPGVFTSDIVLSSSASITSLDSVFLYGLTHTNIGDIKATLTHVDTGTVVDLFNRPGVTSTSATDYGFDANLNGNYGFTQSGTSIATTASGGNSSYNIPSATYGISTSPVSPNNTLLSAFAGQSLGGTWRLTITDFAPGESGALGAWGFNAGITGAAVPEPAALSLLALGTPLLGAYRLRRRAQTNKN